MNRRSFLGRGVAALAGATALAGCLGDDSFRAYQVGGTEVTLASIEVVHDWHRSTEARFVDARSRGAYDRSHLTGAVSSPQGTPVENSPVADWPADDRIVCYCGCPHHLSSLRAATLQSQGYTDVYVLDEGFYEWRDRGYPLSGDDVESVPAVWTVAGVADAGGTAWVRHQASGQQEAGPIGPDGSYELEVRFYGVGAETPVTVETPSYTFEAPLGELASSVVGR